MNIKRVIAVLLAVSILFMAAGCGKKTTDEETSTINIDRVLYPDTDEEVTYYISISNSGAADYVYPIYEGETLPPDYECPLCGHGAADFEPLS